MADLAEFVKTPAGTCWRENGGTQWVTALVGNRLKEPNNSDNQNGEEYIIRLYGEAEIHFDENVRVTLDDISDDVYYRTGHDKGKVTASGPIEDVKGIATKAGGSVAVSCSARGGYRPPQWPLYL